MAIRVVRLGSPPRSRDEGPRLGTVRRPPRGVRKQDYASRDYYDAWLPELAPEAQHLLGTLAALSRNSDFAIGCYCEREERCHRVILEELLRKHGAVFTHGR